MEDEISSSGLTYQIYRITCSKPDQRAREYNSVTHPIRSPIIADAQTTQKQVTEIPGDPLRESE